MSLDIRAMDLLRDAVAEEAAFEKAVELLSVKQRSVRELQTRLTRSGAGKSHVEGAIRRLVAAGYLNDATLADAVARSKLVDGGASRRRVQQLLFRRGVSREVAEAAIDDVMERHEVSEFDGALAAAKRRLRALRSFDAETRRRRLYAFLARRGYQPPAIAHVMKALGVALREGELPAEAETDVEEAD
ncbi:MAG: regulatory protein RecX [Gemmatimonadaceae bacterium]